MVFPSGDTAVSSTELNRPIWYKIFLSSPSKACWAGSIPFEN
jgi:hypothetical protein